MGVVGTSNASFKHVKCCPAHSTKSSKPNRRSGSAAPLVLLHSAHIPRGC